MLVFILFCGEEMKVYMVRDNSTGHIDSIWSTKQKAINRQISTEIKEHYKYTAYEGAWWNIQEWEMDVVGGWNT